MDHKYFPPTLFENSFHCQYCSVYAHQNWDPAFIRNGARLENPEVRLSNCGHCHMTAIGIEDRLIFPSVESAPPPHDDLAEPARSTYMEARGIAATSPRSAAALLRVCMEEVIIPLGVAGTSLNDAVAELVKRGLSPQIQQVMDTVRLIGNEAAHPGTMDLNDDPAITNSLFDLVNVVIETMITQPRKIAELYGRLPEPKLKAIQKRGEGS